MAKPLALFFLIAWILVAGCTPGAEESYCQRLDQMRLMPFRSGESVDDEVYTGLMSEGKGAVACLLEKVTDAQLMPDPRQAPPHPGFAVGDAAVMILAQTCQVPIEQVLPESSRAKWEEQGVYAYFEYVWEREDHRQRIAAAFKEKGCQ